MAFPQYKCYKICRLSVIAAAITFCAFCAPVVPSCYVTFFIHIRRSPAEYMRPCVRYLTNSDTLTGAEHCVSAHRPSSLFNADSLTRNLQCLNRAIQPRVQLNSQQVRELLDRQYAESASMLSDKVRCVYIARLCTTFNIVRRARETLCRTPKHSDQFCWAFDGPSSKKEFGTGETQGARACCLTTYLIFT